MSANIATMIVLLEPVVYLCVAIFGVNGKFQYLPVACFERFSFEILLHIQADLAQVSIAYMITGSANM